MGSPLSQTTRNGWELGHTTGAALTKSKMSSPSVTKISIYTCPSGKKGRDRLQKGQIAAKKLASIYAPTEAKRRIAASKIIPMTCYGSSLEILPKTSSNAIARSVTGAVWGRKFQLRAPEAVRSLVCSPVSTHPYWASIVGCFTDIARCAEKKARHWRLIQKSQS